jgi:hypothetical protein
MSKSEGSSDEAIGRPKPWREGRYQEPGKSVDSTVNTESPGQIEPNRSKDVPVTKKDYE